METDPEQIDVHGFEQGVRGAWLRGETPKELVLTDGSRLRLAPAEEGPIGWHRADEVRGTSEPLSTREAESLAGHHAGYVRVRTRAEAEWLRAVSDWFRDQAGRLEDQLATRPQAAGRLG